MLGIPPFIFQLPAFTSQHSCVEFPRSTIRVSSFSVHAAFQLSSFVLHGPCNRAPFLVHLASFTFHRSCFMIKSPCGTVHRSSFVFHLSVLTSLVWQFSIVIFMFHACSCISLAASSMVNLSRSIVRISSFIIHHSPFTVVAITIWSHFGEIEHGFVVAVSRR